MHEDRRPRAASAPALYHPRRMDKMSTDLSKGFPHSSYKYSGLDPSDCVELDMNEKYSLLEADSKVFSGVLPLSTTMQHRVSCGVQAHKHRYELTFLMPAHDKEDILHAPWRCPGTGPFPRTDNRPPLPPLKEVMADSLK